MIKIKKAIGSLLRCIMHIPRKMHYAKMQKRLINKTPTIIASNCFGGIAYHNLGLRFNSPTINLFFEKDHFFLFVENLQGYLNADLVEAKDRSEEYPVGKLEYNGNTILVFFMHYTTFEDAKAKWEERKKRVDFSNIHIIHMITSVCEEDIQRFEALPYKNKMLIANENLTNSPYVVTHDIFLKKGYESGEVLRYKTPLSVKRHMDDIDYVSFLNSGR